MNSTPSATKTPKPLRRFSSSCSRFNRSVLLISLIGVISVSVNLNASEKLFHKHSSSTTTAAAEGTREHHPPNIYGHIHMAKTGGTTLNWILANNFQHVCGNKGYSYDAYQENERFNHQEGGVSKRLDSDQWSRSRVKLDTMNTVGYEECDYISHEMKWNFWVDTFPNGTFRGVPIELHVPCRNRIDHLMSQCNYDVIGKRKNRTKQALACDAATDEELFQSIKNCFLFLDRFDHEVLKYFNVKCFDFNKQFDGYVQYMARILNRRRFVSEPLARREANDPRDKSQECIWDNPRVMEKVDEYLKNNVPYYQFCDSCMGSERELTMPAG